jgi:hypothetical protein
MNKEQLLEDVKFPLKWDTDSYKMFIFDTEGHMIADVEYTNLDATKETHPYEKLIGDFKEAPVMQTGARYFAYQGDIYDQQKGIRVGSVRNWGHLRNKYKDEDLAMMRQDNIMDYILITINQGE